MAKEHERSDIVVGIMDINIFEDGWNNFNAYVFGLIMSDGCLTKTGRYKNRLSVLLTLNDRELMEYLHGRLCEGNKLYKNKKNYMIKYRNEDAINFMRNYGLEERKSLTLQYPLDLPSEFMPDFIRGFFDGDGSIILTSTRYNVYGQVSFTCGSLCFLESMKIILHELGIASSIYPDGRGDHSCCYLKITKRSEIKKFYNLIYKESSLYLERKHKKFLELFSHELKYNIA